MTRVLITGAGGFLGKVLVEALLSRGYAVRALYHHAGPPLGESRCEVVTGDVRDRAAMKAAATECRAIVHLAGKVHALDEAHSDEQDYEAINVEGTRHLLESAAAAGVRLFIFASSVKVFGETTCGCVDESRPPAPVTAYAKSKWSAEQLVHDLARSGGFRSVSLRLPMVYGPTDKGNLFRMIAAIDRGWFPPIPPLASVRSMLHVGNFTQAVLRILQADGPLRPCYIVTDGTPYSVTTIYELLCAGLGKPVPKWRVPLWLLKAAGGAGDMVHAFTKRPVPLTRAALQKLIEPAWYCSDAIARDLGYRPDSSFEETVPELIAFYHQAQR
ncbi:MAG: NAD-dependent epimerase/dehydratase family protein [Nitrospirota bacterium]